MSSVRRAAVIFTAATAISLAMVNGAMALEADPFTVPESFVMSLSGDGFSVIGNSSTGGNLTTTEQTREIGLGFSARSGHEAGISQRLTRPGRFSPDRFTVVASNTRIAPVLGLRGTTVKQVVRNAMKMRFVWNWEQGKTTIQFTKGSVQAAAEATGLFSAPVYRDDVIRLKQTYRLGPWHTRAGLALGRFDGANGTAAWREETVTANFGIAGRLHRMPLDTELTVRHRMRGFADGSQDEDMTGWKLTSSLNLSSYLWKTKPAHKPYLTLNMGVFGNDPDAVGADSYRRGVEYQFGFRAGKRF